MESLHQSNRRPTLALFSLPSFHYSIYGSYGQHFISWHLDQSNSQVWTTLMLVLFIPSAVCPNNNEGKVRGLLTIAKLQALIWWVLRKVWSSPLCVYNCLRTLDVISTIMER